MKHCDFDVVVVGGGHAGCEAAHAAWRMGCRTALITQEPAKIGVMSCNPAIGGLGKGHLVREIDALDGLMGRVADQAGIQFRLLNRSKGPAVQGPRTQADRQLYSLAMKARLADATGLTIICGEVVDLLLDANVVSGIALYDGGRVSAAAVVLTTGTFLRGVIHVGSAQHPAGRLGEAAAVRLAARIGDLGLPLGRLKTGTPPRLRRSSIDWDRLEMQPPDDAPVLLSFLSTAPLNPQVACGITRTNAKAHEVIRSNITTSAVYSGAITGVGPRYCPSIEDKVSRFSDRDSHQIFLEPEGLTSDVVYPNGISTALPTDVQETFVRAIRGLETAEILQSGYAIEYDYVDPRALDAALQVKASPGLFLAGQINGTTGYEEAAGQGVLAGLNAAARAKGDEPIVLDRSSSYIGVMIDDLITRGVSEPYRMFTSRAEYRLQLRADNADARLTPLGVRIGCVGEVRRRAFEKKYARIEDLRAATESREVTSADAGILGVTISQDGVRRSMYDLMGYGDFDLQKAAGVLGVRGPEDLSALAQLRTDAQYAPYIARQAQDIAVLRREESLALPDTLDYDALAGLSNELKLKLTAVRPRSIAQAGRIEGMTPAALTLILLKARQSGYGGAVG